MEDKVEDTGLLDFFLERTMDLCQAEKEFMKCFVALSIAAYTDELRMALDTPSTEAESHINRLDQILSSLGKKKTKMECAVVASLAEKSNELIKKNDPGTSMRDAAIVYAAQLIQHYKIAAYSVLLPIAKELNLEQASMLLEQCLTEDKNTSAYLIQISQNIINPAATRKD
jgi:ferritin-like metal-binding protein YciE